MSFSLIVPVASDKYEYENKIPDVFLFDKEGIPFCIKSILGLELNKFDCIYFTILKSHDEKYCLKELLKLQFMRLGIVNANVIVLDNPTKSQSETPRKYVLLVNFFLIFVTSSFHHFNRY